MACSGPLGKTEAGRAGVQPRNQLGPILRAKVKETASCANRYRLLADSARGIAGNRFAKGGRYRVRVRPVTETNMRFGTFRRAQSSELQRGNINAASLITQRFAADLVDRSGARIARLSRRLRATGI